jgi:hypothetical protein
LYEILDEVINEKEATVIVKLVLKNGERNKAFQLRLVDNTWYVKDMN